MTPQEIDDFKNKIQEETIGSIIKTININDSYFYASLTIFKTSRLEDPFEDKFRVIVKLNLFNSEEFEMPNITNSNRSFLKAKEIKIDTLIDRNELDNKADDMMLVYRIIAEDIAQNLFMQNMDKVEMIISGDRMYI